MLIAYCSDAHYTAPALTQLLCVCVCVCLRVCLELCWRLDRSPRLRPAPKCSATTDHYHQQDNGAPLYTMRKSLIARKYHRFTRLHTNTTHHISTPLRPNTYALLLIALASFEMN